MDRIEKHIVLDASRSRVWRAISDASEFGGWFGVKLQGEFAEGEPISGPITHAGYEHLTWEAVVERIEPERYLSFRWHPFAVDPDYDYSAEPTTLVELTLEDVEGGTRLTVVESGFEDIPESRRRQAFLRNEEGWEAQVKNLDRYLGGGAE